MRAGCHAAKRTKAEVTETPAAHQNAGGWRVAPRPPASWHQLAVLPLARALGAIGVRDGALSVGFAVPERAAVRAAIGERQSTLAVPLAVFVFTMVWHAVTLC